MEKQVKIKTKDGFTIYGILNSAKKSDKLIIFVHGLGGNIMEHQFFNAVPFFTKRGFDALRISLYEYENDARRLRNTTLSIHGEDVKIVAKKFRNKYKRLYAVGHSFGGPSILLSDPNVFDAIVLWDPTYRPSFKSHSSKRLRFVKALNAYVLDWGIELLIGKGMIEHANTLKADQLLGRVTTPIKIILAAKGNGKYRKEYERDVPHPGRVVFMKKADHNFTDLASEEDLFKETLSWIKKY
jgi:hypothetical protein